MGQCPDVKWPTEYTELTRIEELLHCKICYEYIETSVITPCSHNYCSICIRKFLHYETRCPVCFEKVFEKDLHANRILDEFIQSYLPLRGKLLTCIKGAELKHANKYPTNITPCKMETRDKTSRGFKETPQKLRRNKTASSPNNLTSNDSPRTMQHGKIPSRNIPSSSPSEKTPKMNSMFTLQNEQEIKPNITHGKKVPCPVCDVEISELNINKHLDDCLKRQNSMSPAKTVENDLPPMPKYVMNLMKESELRKVLKKYGLNTSGVRKTLEKRLQKFSTIYNAERDKLSPQTVEELVRICEAEEIAEKNMVKQSSSDLIRNIDRKTDVSLIEKAHKQYLEKNKDDYQKLIEAVKNREKDSSNPSRSSFNPQTGENSIASTSSTSLAMNRNIFNQSDENNETTSSLADTSQFFPHDSNSTNSSYPLQHYSHEDPMRFLALQMSSNYNHESPVKLESSNMSRNGTPMNRIKSEPPEEPENSVEMRISLERTSNNTTSLRSCKNLFPLEEENINNLNASLSLSNYDIFDASTEDNLSGSCRRDPGVNKSKKLRKRVKIEVDNLSTDSETDVETSFRSIGKKSTKMYKHGDKNGAQHVNGMGREESPDLKPENFNQSEIRNKENSKVVDDCKTETVIRRSSRRRNHVAYAVDSRAKKAMSKVSLNLIEGDDGRENMKKSQTKVEEERIGYGSTARVANANTRSFRERRKLKDDQTR